MGNVIRLAALPVKKGAPALHKWVTGLAWPALKKGGGWH